MRIIRNIIVWLLFPFICVVYLIYDECIKIKANVLIKALKTLFYIILTPAIFIVALIAQYGDVYKSLKRKVKTLIKV